MDKYENYFEITEQLYCEALRKMIPPARYAVYTIAVLLLGISSAVMFYGGNYKTGIIWAILAVLLALYGFFGISFKAKRHYRKNIGALCDKEGKFWRRTRFSQDKFYVTEPTTSANLKYSDILGVSETKNLYIILLKEKKLVFIAKNSFKEATNSEFIAFLKEKCNVTD